MPRTRRISFALDLAALAIAIVVASVIVLDSPTPWGSEIPTSSPTPMVLALFVGAIAGEVLARRLWQRKSRQPSYVHAIAVAATSLATVAVGVLALRFYWSRPFLVVTITTWLVVMCAYRAIWRHRPWTVAYAVVTTVKNLADDLDATPHAEVTAIVSPDHQGAIDLADRADAILVGAGESYSTSVLAAVTSAREAGTPVEDLDTVYEDHTGRVAIAHRPDGWEAPLTGAQHSTYGPFKRLLDIVGTCVLAPLALIVVGVAAIAIKLDSSGPVFFHQTRVGRSGTPIVIHKLRTMTDDETTSDRTARDDAHRITGVGRVLRRWRIDEVPQLWNVLRGDLSIVGPRPEQPGLVETYRSEIPFYDQRHEVRPGITGWAQVHHGYASGTEETLEKLGYDLFYVKHMTIWLDLRTLARSLWTVVSGFGAA